MPLARRPVPDTTHDHGRDLFIRRRPPPADSGLACTPARHPTLQRGSSSRGERAYRRHDPSSKTGSHRAAHHPHTGTRLPHASVAHFDMLYFNLRVAGVPLFKADRGAPPVMGVLPMYRSTDLPIYYVVIATYTEFL